jgi:hypothetical protein
MHEWAEGRGIDERRGMKEEVYLVEITQVTLIDHWDFDIYRD